MSIDQGKPQVGLPVFPLRMTPHSGLWVSQPSGITEPRGLEGKRIGCNSFGTNYTVWARGVLRHQYDVAIERITWVESVEEHLPEYRPPKRFTVEKLSGEVRSDTLLADGTLDGITSAAGGGAAAATDARHQLFHDPYPELCDYVSANGFCPINTVVTLTKAAVDRNPDMPRRLMDAFVRAKEVHEREIAGSGRDFFLRLSKDVGFSVTDYGFQANRRALTTMIVYCYEQGIIRRLLDPEELFVLTDT